MQRESSTSDVLPAEVVSEVNVFNLTCIGTVRLCLVYMHVRVRVSVGLFRAVTGSERTAVSSKDQMHHCSP